MERVASSHVPPVDPSVIVLPYVDLEERHPPQHRPAAYTIFLLGQMYLLKKYGSKCLVPNRIKFRVYETDGSIKLEGSISSLRENIMKCLKKRQFIIFIEFGITYMNKDGTKSGHSNLLIYRPFKNVIERFEPNGFTKLGEIDETLAHIFEKQLNLKEFTPVYKPAYFLVPFNGKGLQQLQARFSKSESEKEYCQIWSLFMVEVILMNPTHNTIDIVHAVVDYVHNDRDMALNLIRGYWKKLSAENEWFKLAGQSPNYTRRITRKQKLMMADLDRQTADADRPFVPEMPKVLNRQQVDELRHFFSQISDDHEQLIAAAIGKSNKSSLIHYFLQRGMTADMIQREYDLK